MADQEAVNTRNPESVTEEWMDQELDLAEAMAFAWGLMEAGDLSKDDYAGMVQDLSEMATGQGVATVSVLHVLEARGFKGLGRLMGTVARQYGTPIISLSGFDFSIKPITALPYEFMLRCGTIVFDFFGSDALAVTMSPYDQRLRADVEVVVGRKCHFFVTLPSEFDRALERIATLLDEKRDEEGEGR